MAKETEQKWNFPNAYTAADGKYIAIKKPDKSGGTYTNCKGFLAKGRICDGGVFSDCSLNRALSQNFLNLLRPRPLPKSNDQKWVHLEQENQAKSTICLCGRCRDD